ncbi:MAG: D-2-hydroxyacid dehydrogenase family protein [Alphaproteobacteria bacterium]|nr:D-2-hydroxyacid dehydrogenase family protein [Alphaproteobacteria bacterium]
MALIALLDDYQRIALKSADWSPLSDHEIVAFDDHVDDHDSLAARLQSFAVVGLMRERTPFPRALIARLPNLKLIVTTGMRNASIGVAAARACGVTVCGTNGAHWGTVEFVWASIMTLVRNIAAEDRRMREGGWQHTVGMELRGRTLGVIGLGRIGSEVAKLAQAFGMNILAWSPNMTAERAAVLGATLVDKDSLFRSADVVTVQVVLSDRSRGMIGARELALMKPTAYLVNTSRGPIVDEAALIAVLRSGAIAGAALDVYDREPLPRNHDLRSLPNVLLTPHLGYVTDEGYRVFYGSMVETIRAFFDGAPLRVIENN